MDRLVPTDGSHKGNRVHTRARTLVPRAIVALIMLLMSVVPAGGATGDITFTTISSPTQITAGMPVAYPVTVTNSSRRTINHITVSGAVEPADFEFHSATPAAHCTGAVCTFAQLPAGQSLPEITFYYIVPSAVNDPVNFDTYTFTVTAEVGEGPNDNPNAAHDDEFNHRVTTVVRPPHPDFVGGHSIDRVRGFTTGLGVDGVNPHGTSVTVPTNAKVTVADLPPGEVPACPAFAAATCFGWGSSLDVGADLATGPEFFPNGFEVIMRWDDSQLPKGMTPRKLRVIHLLDNGGYELVENLCTYDGNGLPTNLPCFTQAPTKVDGKDIEVRMLWGQNGVGRGW
jgi:hypothetical protein